MASTLLSVPGIRVNDVATAHGRGSDVLLEHLQLHPFSPTPSLSIVPSGLRHVRDSDKFEMNMAVRLTQLPNQFSVTLPEGHLFRLVTNAELVRDIIYATACDPRDYDSPKEYQLRYKMGLSDALHFVFQALHSYRMRGEPDPPLRYANIQWEKSMPATTVWASLSIALQQAVFKHIFLDRPQPFGHILASIGLEVSELLLLAVAIDARRLTAPIDVNHSYLDQWVEVTERSGLILNEALPLDAVRLVNAETLRAIDPSSVDIIHHHLDQRARTER